MRPYLYVLAISCPVLLAPILGRLYSAPPTTEINVRRLLNVGDFKDERQQLIQIGEKAFPTFEEILSDPKAKPYEIGRVFGVLSGMEADCGRFVGYAVRRLADPDNGVRWSAVELLGRIGTAAEASPVVALLSDREKVVAYAAAKTLAAIGGPREVIAMDAWLLGASHRDDAHLRHHVKQCRDALRKRLTESRAKDKS